MALQWFVFHCRAICVSTEDALCELDPKDPRKTKLIGKDEVVFRDRRDDTIYDL